MTAVGKPTLMGEWRTPIEATEDIDLRRILAVLARRKVLLFAIAASIVALGYWYIGTLAPRYTASTALLLEVKSNSVVSSAAFETGISKDSALIRSQMDILRSRELVRRVVFKLGLKNDPDYNPTLQPYEPNFLTRTGLVTTFPEPLRSWFESKPRDFSGLREDVLESIVVSQVGSQVSILNDAKSYTIFLSFQASEPDKAALIANTFAEMYLAMLQESRAETIGQAYTWLEGKSEELRRRMLESDAKVQAFREKSGIVPIGGSTLAAEQMTRLNGMLIAAQAKRSEAETALREASEIARDPARDGAAAAPASWTTPLLQSLRQEAHDLTTRIAELRTTYRPGHSEVINATARLDQVRSRIREELNASTQRLKAEASAARAEEDQLRHEMDKATQANTDGNRATIELNQLVNDANATRSLYQVFLDGAGRTAAQIGSPGADITVIARAEPPLGSSYPQRTLLLAVTVFAAISIALGVVMILEFMEDSYRTPEEIEQRLGLPVLGIVPNAKGSRGQHVSASILRDPKGHFAESFDAVRMSLKMLHRHRNPKVIMVTSTLPNEGKTTTVISLGRQAASAGKHVLLIECDLRRPKLWKFLKSGKSSGDGRLPGFADVIRGELGSDEVIHVDAMSNMHFMMAGTRPDYTQELLGSTRTELLFREMSRIYDIVIIDTPPVGVVLDALALSGVVDATIMIVRWGSTPRHLVQAAVTKLQNTGNRCSGAILSRVDLYKLNRYSGRHTPLKYSQKYIGDR